jgi:hypothetical protein
MTWRNFALAKWGWTLDKAGLLVAALWDTALEIASLETTVARVRSDRRGRSWWRCWGCWQPLNARELLLHR